jgi:NAD(P)-dependent dehydrogenase (short-subunit alcohol dehydrogenase family)
VATGGGRGVAAAGLRALAEACHPRIVLIGRTELREEPEALRCAADDVAMVRAIGEQARRDGGPPSPGEVAAEAARILAVREVRANLQALRQAGSEVRYLPLDVRDTAAVTAALAEVRREWGPITGVVHAAGVLADRRLTEKTADQFVRVFDTKVAGLRAVLAATAEDPLTVLCVFSSVAARYGNPGQSDYAMANEVLNQVACAEQARRPGCLVRSVAWGPWDAGMVTPALRERFQSLGVPLIPVAAGARAFTAELAGKTGGVQVVIHPAGSTGWLDGSTPRTAAEVLVSARSHPYLADHDIAGTPVVPVAMALEWFVSAARASRPGSEPVALRDVTVLRRLALDRFSYGRHRLVVRGWQDHGGPGSGQSLELLADGGTLHYRAVAEASPAKPDDRAWPAATDLLPVRRPVLYDGHTLFHGPRFRSIVDLAGISPAGAVGTVCGVGDLGWAGTGWHTDPGAVDGALQLAVLWAELVLGGACLPMAVGEFRLYRPGLLDAPAQCTVRDLRAGDAEAECDIRLVDSDGSVRMELLGVQVVLRPVANPAEAA